MSKEFVERRHGSFYLIGSRVPLAHVVREFEHGESPEAIRSHYPTLSIEQVYGAITFYLGHKEEVEKDIAERESEEDDFSKTHPTPPEIKEKFERMRQQTLSRRS
jgi:uncharacterized protein (DUF433 family)